MIKTDVEGRVNPTAQRLVDLLSPVLANADLELVDVVTASLGTSAATVQILVEHLPSHPRGPRIDLDGVSEATKIVDATLETHDPIAGAFTLEVSSPGLERPLRTPAHFERFVGQTISVKTKPGTEGERRREGRLEKADDESVDHGGITIDGVFIAYEAIDRARTVFVWGPQAKPKGPGKKNAAVHPKAARSALSSESSELTDDIDGGLDALDSEIDNEFDDEFDDEFDEFDEFGELDELQEPDELDSELDDVECIDVETLKNHQQQTDKQVASHDETDHNSEETQ